MNLMRFKNDFSLFDEIFGESYPKTDIWENENEIVLTAECAGIDPKNLDLTIENNVLTLKGEKKYENSESSGKYHYSERSYGSFSRSFRLPNNVDTENVKADYSNGVVKITLGKTEGSKSKKIEIGTQEKPKALSASG